MYYKPKNSYRGDPYWTKARFQSQCHKCGAAIRKGENIYYYPKTKTVYCDNGCGAAAYQDFCNCVEAEDFYGGRW